MTKRYPNIPAEIDAELSPKARKFFHDLIDDYERRIAELNRRFAALEEKLQKLTPKNSSIPPSTQHPHAKGKPNPKKRKAKTGKKQGGRGFYLSRNKIEDLYEFGDRFLSIGSVCLDGGANQGIYTMALARYVGATGRVIAVEPFRYAADLILENADLNRVGNVAVECAALSDREGTAVIDYTIGVGAASIVLNFGREKTEVVPLCTIDGLVVKYGLPRIDFIKLDIEGAEEVALRGAAESISRDRPILCLELDQQQFTAVREMLRSYGYTAHLFKQDGDLVRVECIGESARNVIFIPESRQIVAAVD